MKSSVAFKANDMDSQNTAGTVVPTLSEKLENDDDDDDDDDEVTPVDIENMKTSALAGDLCHIFGYFFAILVRVILCTFCVFTVWLVADQLDDARYWGLAATSVLFVVEGIYTIVTRAGQERKWICLCFLCYLAASVPSVWLLELDRLDTFESKYDTASRQVSVSVSGISADIKLDPDVLINITEQSLLFLLILCRWLLPRGNISRDQLSQLLFVFIGMASDVMELFELFDETDVRRDRTLNYVILAVWTVSMLQFSLVLTMSRDPKKARVALNTMEEERAKQRNRGLKLKDANLIQMFLYTEMWSLIISITMQDGPFLAVRLYVLIQYNLITYSILFFTSKNILVISLLLYRLIVICLKKTEDDDDDDVENESGGQKTAMMKNGGTPSKIPAHKQPKLNGTAASKPSMLKASPARNRTNVVAPHRTPAGLPSGPRTQPPSGVPPNNRNRWKSASQRISAISGDDNEHW